MTITYFITVAFSVIVWITTIIDLKNELFMDVKSKKNNELIRRMRNRYPAKYTSILRIITLCIIPIFNAIFALFLLFSHKELIKKLENDISKCDLMERYDDGSKRD